MIIIGAQRKDVGISRSTELPLAADQSAQGRSRRGGRTTAEMTAIRLSLRIPATARTPMNRDRALDPKGLARLCLRPTRLGSKLLSHTRGGVRAPGAAPLCGRGRRVVA